jgi:hypothetical protein
MVLNNNTLEKRTDRTITPCDQFKRRQRVMAAFRLGL